jgi:FixJ family two-component response regulator
VPQDPLIAIVEDDESLRESIVGLVRSLGYRTSSFPSADDFLAAGLAARCDCIVTDIQMPGTSGIDLKLKLVEGGCAVPVIMVTARTEQALHDRALASGAVCLLRKPFTAEALIRCLESALAA